MTQDELILEINQMVSKKDLRILRNAVTDRIKVVGHMVKYSLDRGDIVIVEGGKKVDLFEEDPIEQIKKMQEKNKQNY